MKIMIRNHITSRRTFIRSTSAFALFAQFPAILNAARDEAAEMAVEKAHAELWRRFIDPKWFIFYDHAGMNGEVVIPTPEECHANKPNALSWDISITDGSMFGGMYIEAAIQRWKITGKAEDRDKTRRIAKGLMKLATIGKTKGFLARGLTEDGSAYYPLSSNDQAMPWLYGMWRYLRSGIPDETECGQVKEKIIEVLEVLRSHRWRVPADSSPFDCFGEFASFGWQGASRLLFFMKMAADVSRDSRWEDFYRQAIKEKNPKGKESRLEFCRKGMTSTLKTYHTWTHCPGVTGLRGLWEMEKDPELKAAFEQGLKASAAVAAESLPLARQFDNNDQKRFLIDWRELNALWCEQKTVREAIDLARKQLDLLDSLSPRRVYEIQFMREPLFAAWVITLCPDQAVLRQHVPEILGVIRHYRYERLYTSQFFPAELAFYRLKLAGIV